MALLTINMPSPCDNRFAPDAFDAQIGKPMLLTTGEGPMVTTQNYILRGAEVATDGTSAMLTYETPSLEEALKALRQA